MNCRVNYAQCPVRASSSVWDFNPILKVDASIEVEKIIYIYDTYNYLLSVYPILEEETSTELEFEELTQGVYLVLLYVDGEFRESKLLVVNHP
jgi:hypothetical protein